MALPNGPYTTLLPLVLASASPRRHELLAAAGLDFTIRPAASEPDPDPGEHPEDFAVRAALAKAREVAAAHPDAVVLGADTVVVSPGGAILGKPRDADHAVEQLLQLAGASHRVVSGCALLHGGTETTFFTATAVDMAPAGRAVLAAYAATGEPMDKAGGYAIQGQGAFLVRSIRGSYSGVVGLPVAETLDALLAVGAIGAAG